MAIFIDSFDQADGAAPNPLYWTLANTEFAFVYNKQLRLSGSSGTCPRSIFKLSGDFDIQIDCELPIIHEVDAWGMGIKLDLEDSSYSLVFIRKYATDSSGHCIQLLSFVNNEYSSPQYNQPFSATVFKLRLVRSGSVVSAYTYENSFEGWVDRGTATTVGTLDINVMLQGYSYDNFPSYTVDFDNFTINSGTMIGLYAEQPDVSPSAGTYLPSQKIRISCQTQDATIYYTTDGTEPNETSSVYSDPIPMFEGTLKAYAVVDGYDDSEIVNIKYSILDLLSMDFVLYSDYTPPGIDNINLTIIQ